MWTWLCSWLLALSLVTGSRPRMESTCDTLANKIHLTKEEFNKAKELMKCEGACVSTTMPSAMERSGFTKDCKCCRETGYNERVVTLTKCYDQDGQKLEGTLAQMQVTIKEPSGCECHTCGATPPHL